MELTLSTQPDLSDLSQILREADTIAIVGCSAQSDRTSHKIARYLKQVGYRIIPVNPNYEAVLGETCYPSLDELPDDESVDIVDIFRRPEFTEGVAREVVEFAFERNLEPTIWTQIGVSTPEAREVAEEAGLTYVQNRCIMVMHTRVLGV